MTQINAEVFTSFQSVLDSLEELSIINDTNSANKTTGTLESIPVDLKILLLKLSNLETCLALSESCGSYKKLWESLDKTLVRQKVQKRVPWFALNEGSTGLISWNQCARLVVSRTKRYLDESHLCYEDRKPPSAIIASLEAAFAKHTVSHRRVDPIDVTEDEDLRTKMKPMFPDAFINTLTDIGIVGTTLALQNLQCDLKTMQAITGADLCYNDDGCDSLKNFQNVSPSGLVVKHVNPFGRIAIVDENDHLLLIVHSCLTWEERVKRETAELGVLHDITHNTTTHTLVHKATHPRDAQGCYIIDPSKPQMNQPENDKSLALINLVPGNGGAFIVQYTSHEQVSPYFGYVEPTKDLRVIILFAVPHLGSYNPFEAFDGLSQKFCVTYNGYIYYMHEGRFIRLWVDLGYQKELNISNRIRKELFPVANPQETATRALVGYSTGFPQLGTFCGFRDTKKFLGLIQGDKNQGLDRYVTMRSAYGHTVGDLLTGETYVCKKHWDDRHFVIPFIVSKKQKKKTVGFYTFSTYTSSRLTDILYEMLAQGVKSCDLNMRYDCMHGAPQSLQDYDRTRYPFFTDGLEDMPDYYMYLRLLRLDNPVYTSKAAEFTNVDGDEKLALIDGTYQDMHDWDCGYAIGRHDPIYDEHTEDEEDLYDSDQELTQEQIRTKYAGRTPNQIYRKGKRDARMARGDHRYPNRRDYFMGYWVEFRARYGYKEPSDRDSYWGSNPAHETWIVDR